MKVIFSRKGFDSSYGKQPSIILPKEYGYKMISFPIPEVNPNNIGFTSEDIIYKKLGKGKNDKSLADFFHELKITDKIKYDKSYTVQQNGKNVEKSKVTDFKRNLYHYDPEILETNHLKKDTSGNYYAAFGQSGSAAGTFKNDDLSKGDIFLFYGTFVNTYLDKNNQIKYDKYMLPFHALWGCMVVEDIILINPNDKQISDNYLKKYPNLNEHLHFLNKEQEGTNNMIICSKHFCSFNYDEKYRLTKPGYQKSFWKLPSFFNGASIKYCSENIEDATGFHTAAKGQEFVVTGIKEEQLITWLKDLGVPL